MQLTAFEAKYHSNPFIKNLDINSLPNKIDTLRQICKTSPLEILCIDKTKPVFIDISFPNPQFKVDCFFPLNRRGRDNHKGGKMVFVRSLITKRLENLETKL